MISYERGGLRVFARMLQFRGSVFPGSMCIALPCAGLTALLKFLMETGDMAFLNEEGYKSILRDNSCWSGFVFLVGFLTVFRTSQAYARFWDGCTYMHNMRAEWFDACASLVAFCKYADAPDEVVLGFQHILIRLFSLLHAVALADIEDSGSKDHKAVAAFKYELVDATALDDESLKAVKKSHAKVEMVFQWIQQLIVENIDNNVLRIPAPILSRAFQEIANGMIAFHDAMKISTVPFPFPYAQTCECLLLLHWICTPFVVSQYVSTPWWGAVFSFLQVFVYWSLNAIAIEIENPFGLDANDIDAGSMQKELNRHLLLLLDPTTKRTPTLSADISLAFTPSNLIGRGHRASLSEIWADFNSETDEVENPVKRGQVTWHGVTKTMTFGKKDRCGFLGTFRRPKPEKRPPPRSDERRGSVDSTYEQAAAMSRGPHLARSPSPMPSSLGTPEPFKEVVFPSPPVSVLNGAGEQAVRAHSKGSNEVRMNSKASSDAAFSQTSDNRSARSVGSRTNRLHPPSSGMSERRRAYNPPETSAPRPPHREAEPETSWEASDEGSVPVPSSASNQAPGASSRGGAPTSDADKAGQASSLNDWVTRLGLISPPARPVVELPSRCVPPPEPNLCVAASIGRSLPGHGQRPPEDVRDVPAV